MQALAWEMLKVGDDAPRLVRAALRRLEADPAPPVHAANGAAILSAGRWIAGAIFAGLALVAVALALA
ncbi:hypothetical protein TQ38_021320 [Novosphingobium sp. P6W]|nr:hypothetical protein TQ38_021320 [Novosphingobium sp. P6W]KIS30430.1 hypothetical protein TQ38_22745 [Novosphingobium sp. P6W]